MLCVAAAPAAAPTTTAATAGVAPAADATAANTEWGNDRSLIRTSSVSAWQQSQ